jgi:NAD(P)-dependent dehydrogenase (short-subunit alcohol dehydrogenase family)
LYKLFGSEKGGNMLLANRVALITGGAKGIGRGIALKFAEEGCSVAIADIDIKEAQKTQKELSGAGRDSLAIQCDVTNSSQVKNVVQQVVAKFSKIDILVNNAGGMPSSPPLEEMEEDLWDKVVDLNLKSLFLFCRLVIPLMKEKKYGKVINFSSIGAINPPRHSIHYNSAKAGVLGFTLDLACTVAPFNINVNAIIPGLIQTSFYNTLAGLTSASDQQKEAFFNMLGQSVPLKRIGTPQDIAGAALYLASDLSAYVTGTSLYVSGGMPLQPQSSTPADK